MCLAPDTTTRCFFVFVQNRAANVGTNCMPSRACHSCILCTDRTLCRSAPGLNLCLMARYEARSCISRQSDRDSALRTRRIPSDSWNAPFTLRHPPDNICISCPCEKLRPFIFHLSKIVRNRENHSRVPRSRRIISHICFLLFCRLIKLSFVAR